MNLLKLVTQNGRQGIVKEVLDENLTKELVLAKASEQATDLLGKANIATDKAETVTKYVSAGADVTAAIVAAIKDGVFTPDEVANIINTILASFDTNIDKVLESVKAAIVAKIP